MTDSLLRHLLPELLDSNGLTVIHAGHFMLLPFEAGCAPSVAIETAPPARTITGVPDLVLEALDSFAITTWRLGVALAAALRTHNCHSGLITLVNDWQFFRASRAADSMSVRTDFYQAHQKPFPSYSAILNEYGLTVDSVLPVQRWYPFISESWLRRRLERRLKRALKSCGGRSRLSLQDIGDQRHAVMFDDFGRACRLLVCGQADCAGEVMELVYLLHAMGCRQLVNIVPTECETPVNEGTRRAIAVFQLGEFSALNIAVPCLPQSECSRPVDYDIRVCRVYADRDVPQDDITAIVEPIRWKLS